MDELKHNLLLNLADYTAVIDVALEGEGLDLDDRLWYLGPLAMCSRVFKSVYLDEPLESLEQILRIEKLRSQSAPEMMSVAQSQEMHGGFSLLCWNRT